MSVSEATAAAAGTATATVKKPACGRAGKYLTFDLAGEEFGLEILKVREIISMLEITRLPLTPAFIRGIVNLRGRVIPVMDLRARFGMPAAQDTRSSCIVVVCVGPVELGVVVDKVSEVMEIAEGDIDDVPAFGSAVDTRFIIGVAKRSAKVTLLLDIEKALSGQDVEAISNL
jgi:purine-binding chemotaxis protein CheW